MLKFFGFVLKLGALSLIVLILGNLIHWKGRTISDQVKSQMSQAQRLELVGQVKHWSNKVVHDANVGGSSIGNSRVRANRESQEILPSERQKLRQLIRELNGPSN